MVIVDAHLDLAYNAIRGRAVTRKALEQQPDSEGTPTVGLPDMRAAGIGLFCGTIFCEPARPNSPGGYRTSEEARRVALDQLHWYQQQAQAGELSIVTHAEELATLDRQPETEQRRSPIATILLMEGADPLRSPSDVGEWFSAGLRIMGLAWKRTRYAGGTGDPGPLTPQGVELVRTLDAHGIIHDISHLAEESFWQLMDLASGPVIASHSNCRAIIPTDRHLSDEMIRALVARDGLIGINLFDRFLIPPIEYGHRRATLADVVRQIRYLCDLLGNVDHIGLGTDMDGGFGAEHIPASIRTSADLPRLAESLSQSGFSDSEVHQILGGNWLRFFRQSLPRGRYHSTEQPVP